MFYPTIEPYRFYLYNHHLIDLNARLRRLFSELNLIIDINAVLESVSETLDQIYLTSFVIDFDEWFNTQEKGGVDKYKSYFLNEDGLWKKNIKLKHKFIEKLAHLICNETIINIQECLQSAVNDQILLSKIFNIDIKSHHLTLVLTKGDRHNNGRQPIILSFNDNKVLYKPKVTYTEALINGVCDEIGFYQICPNTINRKKYAWQAFVKNRPVDQENNFHEAYYNYGVILAIMDILNVNDCHFDNFIVDKDQPYLIDSETALQFYHDDTSSDFEKSILQTGLIQKRDSFINGFGHTSAITCITNQFQSYTYPHAINDATDKIKVAYERGYLKRTQNFPYHNNYSANFLDYVNNVIDGYEFGFHLLISKKNGILDLVYDLKSKLYVRYLIRRTSYYYYVIDQMLNPEVFTNFPKEESKFSEKHLKYDDAPQNFSQLISYELSCLKNYNIPIFNIDPFGKHLFDGDGNCYSNFLPQCSISQVNEKLCSNIDYLQRQKDIIRNNTNVELNVYS